MRGFTRAASRRARGAARHAARGSRIPPRSRTCVRLGVTTVELMPIAACDRRAPSLAALGLDQLLGLQPGRVVRARPAARARRHRRSCAQRSQRCTRRASRSSSTSCSTTRGEGDALGPTLSLRGLDNATYYRPRSGRCARATSTTPAAATRWRSTAPPAAASRARRAALLRGASRASTASASISRPRSAAATTASMPRRRSCRRSRRIRCCASCKLIAEPWDVGPGGYRLGAFPAVVGRMERPLSRRRAAVLARRRRLASASSRRASRARPMFSPCAAPAVALAQLRHRARRLHARRPRLLRDQAQRGERRRQSRRQRRRTDSWNHGVEGADRRCRQSIAARERDVRNLLATLLLSRGTPMLAMGDELGRTQQGNNNAYAQDNALTWIDWERADEELIDFVARAHRAAAPPPGAAGGSLARRHAAGRHGPARRRMAASRRSADDDR